MSERRHPSENYELLIRLDEQVKSLTKKIDTLVDGLSKDVEFLKVNKASKQDLTDLKFAIQNDMSEMKDIVKDAASEIVQERNSFIRKEEFDPIKKFVYGLIGMVLLGVLTAILALVFK